MECVINILAIWSIFIDRGRKTVCRSKRDLLLRRNHFGRHKLDTLGQLLVALDAATYLVAGTSLEQYQPRFHVKTWNWPRVMNLGMVISILIGKSACLLPKSDMLAHGRASETERIWVDNEGLSNLRRLKIQSTPYGNIGDKVRIFELVEKATTLLA
jgi:hypothetical protein